MIVVYLVTVIVWIILLWNFRQGLLMLQVSSTHSIKATPHSWVMLATALHYGHDFARLVGANHGVD